MLKPVAQKRRGNANIIASQGGERRAFPQVWAPILALLATTAWAAILTALCVQAEAQAAPRRNAPGKPSPERRAQNAARRAAALALADPSDPEAVALLRQMLRPLVDYAADEQTW